MTLCIVFFLCLIDVISYDLVQVKSSGCRCRYSIPSHESEDSLWITHFFPQFMPPWTFWWLCVFNNCNYFCTEGWGLSFLTMVFSEYFLQLGMQWSCEPLPVDAWVLRPPAVVSYNPGPSPMLWTPIGVPIFPHPLCEFIILPVFHLAFLIGAS